MGSGQSSHHGGVDQLDQETLRALERTYRSVCWSSTHPVLDERTFVERVELDTSIPGLAARLFRSLDASGKGELMFAEFVAGHQLLRHSSGKDHVKLMLTMYGAHGRHSTHIDRRGLRDLQLDLLAAHAPPAVAPFDGISIPRRYTAPTSVALRGLVDAMATAAMVRFDADGDDRLAAAELAAFMMSEGTAVQALLSLLHQMGMRLYGGPKA